MKRKSLERTRVSLYFLGMGLCICSIFLLLEAIDESSVLLLMGSAYAFVTGIVLFTISAFLPVAYLAEKKLDEIEEEEIKKRK